MRTSTLSTIAWLASSLLVKDVVAGRFDARKRDAIRYDVENVWVTEEVTVTKEPDGSYKTGEPVPIATVTINGETTIGVPSSAAPATSAAASTPVVVPSSQAPASSAPASSAPASSAPVVDAKPAVTSSSAAVFIEKPSSTPVAKPTTSSTPVAVPTTAPAPTTLQTQRATSSAAPVASSSAAPVASSGGKKRGVAYNDASLISAFTSDGNIGWAYNWGSSSGGSLPSGIEYVPLCWGSKSFSYWSSDATKAIAAGSTHLMSFNEPDLPAQANMDVPTAVTNYKAQMMPFSGKATLGAPAVTNGLNSAKTMGLDWLSSFVQACDGCDIGFVAIHWYQSIPLTNAIADFKQHCQDAYTAGGNKPVWVTEFQYLVSADENSFLEQILPWLDAPEQSYIQRYSYFMAADGNLNSGTGLSITGNTYASAS
ncbi:hypothetical protein G7Y89_g5480 [Cudoniella acicularis]|uniref:Asl1-like glycosyl hydrolase catalytic domain-containing protein n=1 Tax=Cudoniella acicularis TaxID=354080 RepID=A0A8H4W3Y1_9HELO|nr:hypothetical protein G7Y89_g5480 [Cudoniella acicularis]